MDDPRTAQIQGLAEPILADRAMELVEFTCRRSGGQLLIRLLVDRVGGVTIQQCAQANQVISEALEGSGLIPESYTVEVSSPGLDRPLATRRDFERAIGEDLQLEVRIDDPSTRTTASGRGLAQDSASRVSVGLHGRFTSMRGMLLAVQPEAIVMKTPDGNVTVPMGEIRVAKKAIRWSWKP